MIDHFRLVDELTDDQVRELQEACDGRAVMQITLSDDEPYILSTAAQVANVSSGRAGHLGDQERQIS